MVCNLVYAHIVQGAEPKDRDRFNSELYAPEEGWEAANKRVLAKLDQAT